MADPGDARQQAAERGPEWDAPPEWRQDVQKIRLALGPRLAKRVGRLLVRVQEAEAARKQTELSYFAMMKERNHANARVREAERALRVALNHLECGQAEVPLDDPRRGEWESAFYSTEQEAFDALRAVLGVDGQDGAT